MDNQEKPVLLVMAAGMGSRYGGLKQIDKVTEEGEIIIDFSLYDARRAGFKKVVFIIKKEHEKDFREIVDNGAGKFLDIEYAFQDINDLPKGYSLPEGREKPWGTGQAILSARQNVKGPFAVINGDDYYGPSAFSLMYEFLENAEDKEQLDFCMIGYDLVNTLTENGHVSRGVCSVSNAGILESVTERTQIEKRENVPQYTEDEGNTWNKIDEEAIVSMNFWGYTEAMMKELDDKFPEFLDKAMIENPLKGEYLIPKVTDALIKENKAVVKVLQSKDKWFGVTYKEDKEYVSRSLKELKEKGLYPKVLWG